MAHATLIITPPKTVWAHQISSTYPETTFRVLAAVPSEKAGFALLRITGPDVLETVEAMVDHPQITELTPIQRSEDEVTVHFEVTSPFLFMASRESGIAVELPVVIRDGEATVEVTGSHDRISELVDELEGFGVSYHLKQIGQRHHERQLLSDRQREFVVAALEQGYYDTPRRCSLTDVADALGVAKSTCSETLHRAEETIVKHFATQLPDVDAPLVNDETSQMN